MGAHSRECEHADVGSLCDCDCAGARHAIARTTGGVPGAGAVSRRAQAVAHRDNRAAVVNNTAEPADDDRHRAGRARRPAGTAAARSSNRTPALSPTVKANANDVRARLPKDAAGWKAAALQPPTAAVQLHHAQAVDAAQADLDRVEAARDAIVAGHAADIRAEIAADRAMSAGRNPADIDAVAAALAPHRAWSDPRYNRLDSERYDAQRALRDAQTAQAAAAAGDYPIDAATGYRMPSAKLREQLRQVTDVGRQALQEAKAAWQKNPPAHVAAAQQLLPLEGKLRTLASQLRVAKTVTGGGLPRTFVLPEGGTVRVTTPEQLNELQVQTGQRRAAVDAARATIAKHQADTLRAMLAEHRSFGAATHTTASARRDTALKDPDDRYGITDPRSDWRARLQVAEQHFPTDWIHTSATRPLNIGASRRAYQGGADPDGLSMSDHSFDTQPVLGALDDVDEVTVHEMGHRMEYVIPGLKHLEFAYVRQRATAADGTVEPILAMAGYKDTTEVAQKDHWGRAYAGKTYELDSTGHPTGTPGDRSWEVFQVGLQDTFARGPYRYGPDDDPEELQAFVIGALLTLG
jgi:hypothetical protein